MSKNDAHSQLGGNKRLRRKWITWMRMMRYGVNNFTRNLWLTTAATAVMTITLLIILTTFVARVVLNDTVQDIRAKVDIPINLKSTVTDKQIANLRKNSLNNQTFSRLITSAKSRRNRIYSIAVR